MCDEQANIDQLIEIELYYAKLELERGEGEQAATLRALDHVSRAIALGREKEHEHSMCCPGGTACHDARSGQKRGSARRKTVAYGRGAASSAPSANIGRLFHSPLRERAGCAALVWDESRPASVSAPPDRHDSLDDRSRRLIERQMAIVMELEEAGLPAADAWRLLEGLVSSEELVCSFGETVRAR